MSRYSAGDAQRKIAADLGVTTVELNERAEQDPSIDQRIDAVFAQFAQTETAMVIDSRMAWYFLPLSFKVRLQVFPLVAARRVFTDLQRADERYGSVAEAATELQRRRRSERSRFNATYGVDIDDYHNFDLVIDTTLSEQAQIAELIIREATSFWSGTRSPMIWVSPRLLFPTKVVSVTTSQDIQAIRSAMAARGYDRNRPIEILELEDFDFIFDGHKRTSSAILESLPFVPTIILPEKEIPFGLSARQYLRDHFTLTKAYDWEDAHKFKFHSYPEPDIFTTG
jgi:cytidylate kinase